MGVGYSRIRDDEDARRPKPHVLKSESNVRCVSDQSPMDISVSGHSVEASNARSVALDFFEQRVDTGGKLTRGEIGLAVAVDVRVRSVRLPSTGSLKIAVSISRPAYFTGRG
jgi:hypothetical protein